MGTEHPNVVKAVLVEGDCNSGQAPKAPQCLQQQNPWIKGIFKNFQIHNPDGIKITILVSFNLSVLCVLQ